MSRVQEVVLAQPNGLTLNLSIDGTELRVRLFGGGLRAVTSAELDRAALAQFFADAATLTAPHWGRWEYKSDDENVMLHACPDESGGVLLAVSLLASYPDESDWKADGTLVLDAASWAEATAHVHAACG